MILSTGRSFPRSSGAPGRNYGADQAFSLQYNAPELSQGPGSDDHNIFSILFASSQLRYRSQFNQLPPNLLVN
jgi:hypothetical protein